MSTTYGAMLLAVPGEDTPVTFEGLTAKLLRVTIIVAGPGSPIALELWDRSTGESLLLDRELALVAGTKVTYMLNDCTSFRVVAQSHDEHEMWSSVSVQAEYMPEPQRPKALVPTRHRRYPNKVHRRRRSVSLGQPKLAATLGPLVAGLINLPVAQKIELAQAVATLQAMERLAAQPGPMTLEPIEVVVRERDVRKLHRFKYDADGEVAEIEEVVIPVSIPTLAQETQQ